MRDSQLIVFTYNVNNISGESHLRTVAQSLTEFHQLKITPAQT